MKTRFWVILLSVLLLISLGLSFWLLQPGEDARAVQIWSDGKLLYTLDLQIDQMKTVESEGGVNVIRIEKGKIAVTEADCPDGHCIARGYCSGGVQIVCLPNRLVIKFTDDLGLDGVVG